MSWEDIVSKEDKAKGKLSKWCAIYGYTPLHQQVSIWPCTRPGRPDRCFSKTEGCWGVKEAINILSAWLSLSASVCTARSLSLAFHHFPSFLPHLSFSFTRVFLSFPAIIHTWAQFRGSKSLKVSPLYFNPLLLPKIFISLFLSSAFASWDFRETKYKSDPGPWGVGRKTMGFSFGFFKPTFSCLHAPNPSLLPSHLRVSGVCILSAQSGCYVWGSGTNMGNKLQNEMLLLMCKHSLWQHGVSTHPHTHCTTACMLAYDTYAGYTSMLQTVHSQHICKD